MTSGEDGLGGNLVLPACSDATRDKNSFGRTSCGRSILSTVVRFAHRLRRLGDAGFQTTPALSASRATGYRRSLPAGYALEADPNPTSPMRATERCLRPR